MKGLSKKKIIAITISLLAVIALIFGSVEIYMQFTYGSRETRKTMAALGDSIEEYKNKTAEPSDVELITYSVMALRDYLAEPTFKFDDDYNVVETKGTLKGKVEGTVTDAYKTDHDFTIILEFNSYEYKTYSIYYLQIDGVNIVALTTKPSTDSAATTTEPTTESATTTTEKQTSTTTTEKQTTTQKETTTKSATTTTTTTESQATLGELNALSSAKSYLNYSDFSEKGLRNQLDYEGYSSSEIDYAIKNCGADWKEECVGKAKSYLDYSSFSEKGLRDQLDYEGFSSSEIDYAINNCGADWNEECAEKAKSYLEYSSFSRDGLKAQLEYEGFTSSQIEYGLSAVGY